jgi:hypothetical protein
LQSITPAASGFAGSAAQWLRQARKEWSPTGLSDLARRFVRLKRSGMFVERTRLPVTSPKNACLSFTINTLKTY